MSFQKAIMSVMRRDAGSGNTPLPGITPEIHVADHEYKITWSNS